MSTPVDPGNKRLVGTAGERTIGQLVGDVSTDLSQILRGEIELAKVEIKQDVQHAGKGAGMFAGAGVLALYGLGLLFLGLAAVLDIWLPWWASLLIVAAVLFLVAGILALVGKKQVSQVKGKPERAISNAQQTVTALKPAPVHVRDDGGTTGATTTTPAIPAPTSGRGGATAASALSGSAARH